MMIEITESKLLCWIRRWSLWSFLGASILYLVIQLLVTWNAIETVQTSFRHYGEANGWGRIQNSLTIILYISLFVLLTVLIAKYAKAEGDAGAKASSSSAKASGSTAKVPTSSAKKVVATKKAASKK